MCVATFVWIVLACSGENEGKKIRSEPTKRMFDTRTVSKFGPLPSTTTMGARLGCFSSFWITNLVVWFFS